MASAGRILIIPKGNYDSAAAYEQLDLVFYNGNSWLCKSPCTGVVPSDDNSAYWHRFTDLKIVSNLTTEDTGSALDATMGKALKDEIDSLDTRTTDVENEITNVSNQLGGYSITVVSEDEEPSDSAAVENTIYFVTKAV